MGIKDGFVATLKYIFVIVAVLVGMLFNKRLLIAVGKVASTTPTIVYNFHLFFVIVISLPFTVKNNFTFGIPSMSPETSSAGSGSYDEPERDDDLDELVGQWGTLSALQQPAFPSLSDITTVSKGSEGQMCSIPIHSSPSVIKPQVIEMYGYPCETHRVRSEDGYILTMHRIPYPRGHSTSGHTDRPVVFLQHGLFGSSFEWFMNTPDKLLALQLVEAGYDAWFGNMRGNTYCREHVKMSPKHSDFWEFSVHEMGKYDLPAQIDYILARTGEDRLRYIGYSTGNAMFWIMMSLRPEYNAKVKVIVALAPIVYINNVKGFPGLLLAPFRNQIKALADVFFHGEILPPWITRLYNRVGAYLSSNSMVAEAFCANINFFYPGWDLQQTQLKQLPLFYSHMPSPTSARTLAHIAQLMMKGVFAEYDWGAGKNLEIYGQPTPPKYFLSRTKVPVVLLYGLRDAVVEPAGVQRVAAELPNVVEHRAVPFPLWNHFDFHLAKDVNPLLNTPLLNILERYK